MRSIWLLTNTKAVIKTEQTYSIDAIDTIWLQNRDTYKICVIFRIYLVVSIALCKIEKIKKNVQVKTNFKAFEQGYLRTMRQWTHSSQRCRTFLIVCGIFKFLIRCTFYTPSSRWCSGINMNGTYLVLYLSRAANEYHPIELPVIELSIANRNFKYLCMYKCIMR